LELDNLWFFDLHIFNICLLEDNVYFIDVDSIQVLKSNTDLVGKTKAFFQDVLLFISNKQKINLKIFIELVSFSKFHSFSEMLDELDNINDNQIEFENIDEITNNLQIQNI